MQKTVLFGKTIPEQQTSKPSSPTHCPNCHKLLIQLTDLNKILAEREQNIRDMIAGSENGPVKMLQGELMDLKEKYLTLKKRLKQIQKQNEDLFLENTTLGKQLSAARMQIRQLQTTKTDQQGTENAVKAEEGRIKQSFQKQGQSECKRLQIDVFVWREKAEKLQSMLKSQGEQLVRLKELLRKRNRLQDQRHQMLQILV